MGSTNQESVPTIEFYNSYLNNTITLRDMLSHRTGITRMTRSVQVGLLPRKNYSSD